MSRTDKTKKVKFRKDKTYGMPTFGVHFWESTEWYRDNINPKFYSYPKLRKTQDYEDHWMSTPSEWTRLMMNRPMRRKQKQKLKVFDLCWLDELKEVIEEYDEEEGYSKKPHKYYW